MSPKPQGTAHDEQAIRNLTADFVAAWNKNDAKALAACFATDGDLINPAGRVGRGNSEVEKILAEEQSGTFRGTRMNLQQKHLRFLKPDVAVADFEFHISGVHTPDGKQTELKGLLTNVFLREGEKWRVTSARPSIPAPLPGATR